MASRTTRAQAPAPPAPDELIPVPLGRIAPSPLNPRKTFDPAELQELATSIHAHGVLQPILLRPWPKGQEQPSTGADYDETVHYELVDGERRWRAACLAGLKVIRATVRNLSDRDVLEIAVVTCEQRADVAPLEKAAAYARLIDEHGVSVDDLAKKIGKSVSAVRGLLKLRQLPVIAAEAVEAGTLPAATAGLIARVPGAEAREKLALHVLAGEGRWNPYLNAEDVQQARGEDVEPLSYRDTQDLIGRSLTKELKGAPFSQADKKLVPEAGSCKDCPRRVGNLQKAEPGAYDGARADVCTDPLCYERKLAALRSRLEQQAADAGVQTMTAFEAKYLFQGDGTLEVGCGWTDIDSTWNPDAAAKKRQTYREAFGGLIPRAARAVIDPAWKLRYLVPAKVAAQELEAAGLIDRPKAKPKPGSPEHLDDLADRQGIPREEFRADHTRGSEPEPKTRKPAPYAINARAAGIAGQVLYETAKENADGLEGLESCGGSETNAAWEALKLLCLSAAWQTCGGDGSDAQELSHGVVGLVHYIGRDDKDKSHLAAFRSWIDRARPAELIGFLLKATTMHITTYPNSPEGNPAAQALLDWGELDWDQLREQAERELTTGKKTEAKEKPAKKASTTAPVDDGPVAVVGDTVRTSYGTGPYVVVSVGQFGERGGRPQYSLTLRDFDNPKQKKDKFSHLNDYQRQADGRITSPAGDEIVVLPAGTGGGPTLHAMLAAAGQLDRYTDKATQRQWMLGELVVLKLDTPAEDATDG
jgi:ParB/RepB/Spo0J family partition protein